MKKLLTILALSLTAVTSANAAVVVKIGRAHV